MKIKLLYKAAKIAAACACVAVCVFCVGAGLKNTTVSACTDALLFISGLGLQSEPPPESTASENDLQAAATPVPSDGEPYNEVDGDGIVPYFTFEQPTPMPTPDPTRSYGEVEEITLDGGTQVDNFYVRDTTDSGTDLLTELAEEPSVSLKRDGSVEILIYHTHTSEAYSESYTGFYYTDMETRTSDTEQSVVAVGEALKAKLESYGFGVVHDTAVNDEIFNGSYSRSWQVIQDNLAEYPNIQVTIDLHRDSMTTEAGTKYKPTTEINGRKAAQIMLLAGCDENGDWGDFPNWRENLRLILRVQQKAAQLYPTLARPLSFSNCKYNMNATVGSMLIEVGTEVNTAAEAEYSGRLLGEILAEAFIDLQN